MNEKRCSKCKQVKALAEFSVCRRDGWQSRCRACEKLYRDTHKVEIAARGKLYTKEHKKEKAAYRKAYRLTHRVELAAHDKAYHAEHRAERVAYSKDYYQSEAGAARIKVYRATHKVKMDVCRRVRNKAYLSTLHGYLHNRWRNMCTRCTNPKTANFKNYGGKGVKNLFRDFEEFYGYVVYYMGFVSVSMLNGLEIHRIGNGHYELGCIEFLTTANHAAAHRDLKAKETT